MNAAASALRRRATAYRRTAWDLVHAGRYAPERLWRIAGMLDEQAWAMEDEGMDDRPVPVEPKPERHRHLVSSDATFKLTSAKGVRRQLPDASPLKSKSGPRRQLSAA